MFGVGFNQRPSDGASQTGGKETKPSGSKVTPEVTLPLLCPHPTRLSAASVVRPSFSQGVSDRSPSAVELPTLPTHVGLGRAIVKRKWSEGPRPMVSDIPIRACLTRARDEDKSKTVTVCKKKNTSMEKDVKFPVTGVEVIEFLSRARRLDDKEFYYMKGLDEDVGRHYDLRVVQSSHAGSDHYIFSPTSVLHMTETGFGGLVSLAQWHGEFEKWKALQEIPFLSKFRLHKAFAWWRKNARRISFQRKCKNLQEMLLVAVPQFRHGLHVFASVAGATVLHRLPLQATGTSFSCEIFLTLMKSVMESKGESVSEELKAAHWIPLDGCKTYTLLELRKLWLTRNQEHLQILKKLSMCRAATLNTVKDESYKTHQELQLHLKLASNPNRSVEPIHQLRAHQQALKRELARSEGILQKLGKFAALIHQMLVQTLITVAQQDAVSLLSAGERMKSQQRCLFSSELSFTAVNEVTVNPPPCCFQEAVSEALLSASSSLIQMCESCGLFLEISGKDFSSPKGFTCDSSSCAKRAEITEERSEGEGGCGLLRDGAAHWVTLPNGILTAVRGSRVRGCYTPLSKTQLEWHISVNDVTKQVEKEQAKIMEDAEMDIQQLCESFSWLVDIQLHVSQWSGASLEVMKGQPVSLYTDHIRKLRDWAERISKLDSAVSTTNQLFIIHCNHIKETLGQRLKAMDEEILEHLTEQIQLQSAHFISDLEETSEYLNTEPQDLTLYAARVRQSEKMLSERRRRLDYIHSLSETVCVNYRKMTEQELALREKISSLWDCFIPILNGADNLVCRLLPSVMNTLDTVHPHAVCDTKNAVTDGASEPVLDPTQCADEMPSRLDCTCAHVPCARTHVEDLNRSSQEIQEHSMDLTFMAGNSTWSKEWKQLPFCEVLQNLCHGWENRLLQVEEFALPAWQLSENQSELENKVTEDTFSNSPATAKHSGNDARVIVTGLEAIFVELESDLMTLSTMLKSPHSVDFKSQLKHLVQSLQELKKLLDVFQRYQQMWAFMVKVFSDASFSDKRVDLMQLFLPVDETFKQIMHTILSDPHVLNVVSPKTGGRFHGNALYHILSNGLSTMETISNQMTDFFHVICQRYPRFWFLRDRNVMELLSFHSTPILLQRFVRQCFQGVEWLEIQSLISDVETSEDAPENENQSIVLGIFGSLQEHIPFPNPLEQNPDVLLWFSDFEKQLKLTMKQLMKKCAVVHKCFGSSNHNLPSDKATKTSQLCAADVAEKNPNAFAVLSDFPLQCVLVAEEAVWCQDVVQAFQESNPRKLSHMKALNSEKLKELVRTIRDGITGCTSESLASKYRMTYLRALAQLTMNHSQHLSRLMDVQIPLESSFEWLSLIKYSINSEDVNQEDNARTTCYIDVLDHRLQYGFEYFGPEDLMIACTPSTDQAMLGIVLALTNFRAAFVSGPRLSGKKTIALHLGKVLGRQIAVVQCCPTVPLSVIHHMLLGSLQTGAFLYLDSVNFLTQGIQSILGQHLLNIHQSFTNLRSKKHQDMNVKQKDIEDLTFNMEFAGEMISARPSYGCIITSSQWYTSNIPDSFRFATRPIALKCPDHRIIAEVMLTSLGFSEAMPLSHRLVSLLSLAKDSHSLPECFTADPNGFVAILQKVISVCQMHLYQTMQQREKSNEACFTADACTFSQMTPENIKEKKENERLSKLRQSHLLVVQSLLEETAVVRAILSVVMPEHSKTSQFFTIFKDTFPIVGQFQFFQQLIEEMEKSQLQDAVREELQQKQLHSDSEIISSTVRLYQAIKVSQAAILIGPTGSGKSTCYSALAGALNSLAAKSKRDVVCVNTAERQQMCASSWSFVNFFVLFPNAMSHEEMFGKFTEQRKWCDGAVAKALREQCDHTHPETNIDEMGSLDTSVMKWMVMDGEPLGQPSWLDYLTSLCSNQSPCLRLPSGETLQLCHSNFKLVIEMTDLDCATPSTATCCSLVFFTSVDLWKSVWESEINALSFEHNLDQGVITMWNSLTEDLFHNTLTSEVQKGFTSAVQTEGKHSRSAAHGIQEVMSFVRILRALLHHFKRDIGKPEEIPQIDNQDVRGTETPAETSGTGQNKEQLMSRDIFLVAYIWGFGGHLHNCHWAEFDTLARNVLLACRHKIVVPEDVSVYDHFFSIDAKFLYKNTMVTSSIIPKYEKYSFLMNVMLKANQPVLLVGESSSGKSTLCKNLLKFDKPHFSLPASPLLSARHIRTILKTASKRCRDTVRSAEKQPYLLLFVDDLHEAPCDVFGKESKALETLRQSISKKETATVDPYECELLSSETVKYMATCCASGLMSHHSNAVSSRLSRLFSIFVLPDPDVALPINSHFKIWLKEIQPEDTVEDISHCIVTATKYLCFAVRNMKPESHLIFSHHDIQKVLWGMCLHQSENSKRELIQNTDKSNTSTGPPLSVLKIVNLWMHECMRTFNDRLCSEHETQSVVSLIAMTAATMFRDKLVAEIDSNIFRESPTVSGSALYTLSMGTAFTYQKTGSDTYAKHLPPSHGRVSLSAQSLLWKMTGSSNLSQTRTSSQNYEIATEVDEHVKNAIIRLAYGPKMSETRDYGCGWSYQEQDLEALLLDLSAVMDRKEEEALNYNEHGITNSYIVHRQGASQLLHILRALLIPGGHGVLIGSSRGTGRKTTVRLAAYLTGFCLIEIHAGNENQLHEILQKAATQIRTDEVKVIILVHEEISETVREELLVAMSQRSYPALHPDTKLGNIVSRATAVNNSRRCLLDCWVTDNHLHQVHRNIHVFLLMPLTKTDNNEMSCGKSPLTTFQAQMAKAVKLCCCVEVYQPWSHQCLVETAAQCFQKQYDINFQREGLKDSLCVAMAGIHQTACQYANVLLTRQPFNPLTFLGLIAQFASFCNIIDRPRQKKSSRVASALGHLDVLNDAAEQSIEEVVQLQNTIDDTLQHEKETLEIVVHHKKLCKEARTKSKILSKKLSQLKEQIADLDILLKPAVSSSILIPHCLNSSDLEEVRHYRDPPEGVVKIMDAVCLMFDRPPGWENAKHLLGQPDIFLDLQFFDQYSLTKDKMNQLRQIVCSPQFLSVQDISKALESLCHWIRAMYQSCCMRQQHLLRQHLEAQAGETEMHLSVTNRIEKEASDHFNQAKLELQLTKKDLQAQTFNLQKAESVKKEISTCAKQSEMHHKAWKTAAHEAELHSLSSQGDALIVAAVISYLGPFVPHIRQELVSKWKELCNTGIININPEDPRTSLFQTSDTTPRSPSFGFPIPVTEKLQLPLGQVLGMREWQVEDNLSSRLLVKLLLWGYRHSFVQCWPLLADTQLHLEIRLKNQLPTGENRNIVEETDSEMVVCADDPKLLDKLEKAAQKGLRVLVTHVERAVPSPNFLAILARPAACFFGLKQPPVKALPEFSLLLSTDLPVKLLLREIHPSILAQVHVVDLSPSSEEIQELLLTQLLQSECANLLTQHSQLLNYNQQLQEKLFTEEASLMDYILQCDTELQKHPGFVSHLANCEETMKKLQADIKQLKGELKDLESLLATPRHLMRLAASLYQALQEVSHLSPAYDFPLRGFIKMILQEFTGQTKSLVHYSARNKTGRLLSQLGTTMALRVLVQYRPRLFQSHAAVLKLLVSLALLKHNDNCSEAEKLAFLRGLEDLEGLVIEATQQPQLNPDLPSWISPQVHTGLLCLENIPALKGLLASLSASPMPWQKYLRFPSPTVIGAVPCSSHSHLSLLQRALLWKTLLPNSLEGVADGINTSVLCPFGRTGADAPHVRNPEALSQYLLKHGGPIILVLPDPKVQKQKHISIHPLGLIHQLSTFAEVGVKSVTFGELCDSQLIMSLLERAVNEGHWLIFNNCHLSEQWDEKVVAKLCRLVSFPKEEEHRIHPQFRLWFITLETATQSIPVAVRLCALTLTCDSAWDLNEELSCSLRQLLSVSHSLGGAAENMELLLRCAIFHSVLLQRQAFKYGNQERIYYWSGKDLLALIDSYMSIATLCHDQHKVLQSLAVDLVQGSHVIDSVDSDMVESIAEICFNTELSFTGIAPHLLSDIVHLPELLQNLHETLKESGVIDPLLLGFGVDVSAEISSHNLNTLLQATQAAPGTGFMTTQNYPEVLAVWSHVGDQLQALKSYLAHRAECGVTAEEALPHSPLRDFLQAEWDDLIDSVSSLLSQSAQYTPTFSSLVSLTKLSRLERRAELLSAYLWHHNVSDPPGAYRVAAFKNAGSFLVAVMRQAAQVNCKYISDITLHFEVLLDSTYPASLPLNAVYLCGLELKGASWDTQIRALQEASSQSCPLPLLCVKAEIRNTAKHAASCKSSYLLDACNIHPVSTLSSPQLPVYHCPLYVNEEQDAGNDGLIGSNIVTKVPLYTKISPALCSLRRVRLVSTL